MARDDRRRRAEDEDLFEDLDDFFAPLESGDWPEEKEGTEAQASGGAAPQPEAPQPEAPQPEAPGGEVPPEAEDAGADLEGWAIDVDIPEEDELVAGAQESEEVAEAAGRGQSGAWEDEGWLDDAGWEELLEPEAEGTGTSADLGAAGPVGEEPDWVKEATAEMGGEDWEALRGRAATEAAPEGPEGAEDLTPDELSAAPPQYADLPVPDEVEAVPVEDLFEQPEVEVPVEIEEEGAPAATVETPDAEAPAAGAKEPAAAEEPEEAAVEAAADRFAEGIREPPEQVERDLLADLEEEGEEPEVQTVKIEPGAAPTWEEGVAAEPEPEEEAAAPSGRNITAALVSGVLLGAAVIALLAIGKGPFTVLAAVAVLLGQAELYAVMRARRLQPATLLGLVCGALIIAGAAIRGEGAVSFGLFLSMALTVLWFMAAPAAHRKNVTVNAAVTVLGVVYVPFLASYAILLLELPGDLGRNVFLTVVGLAVLYDVCAYAIGSLWGTRPLAPTISPQKSWEGVIGATIVLLLVGLAIVPSIEPFTASRAVGTALVVSIAAPLGDLIESALKRDLRVKDMGTLLPGHGGILDRIDAILLAAPAAYYFLLLSF